MAVDQQTCKLDDLCRLCLEGPGCIDIFNTYFLPENIYSTIGVKVCTTDKLPRMVCSSCYEIVKKASHLRTIASNNEIHLKVLINAINHRNSLHTNQEKENIYQDSRERDVENICNKGELNHSVNNDTISCISNDNDGQFFKPFKIKVRTDLFHYTPSQLPQPQREPENEEMVQERKICKRESTDVAKDELQKIAEYKCDVCLKLFKTAKKLYLHKRHHNRTHTCMVYKCEKKFATKGDLDKHIRTHTGEKPFVCSFCEKGFAQGGTLKCHMESVHGMCKVEVREELIFG